MVDLIMTALVVAVAVCATVATLVGLMQAADAWRVRAGARQLVRDAEALLERSAASPA